MTLYYINIIMVFMHGVILFVLCKNTLNYSKQFGSKQDPYTLGTLVLLGLSTLALFINLPSMILSLVQSEEWLGDNSIFFICSQIISVTFSETFFILAIAVNSTRWALLII